MLTQLPCQKMPLLARGCMDYGLCGKNLYINEKLQQSFNDWERSVLHILCHIFKCLELRQQNRAKHNALFNCALTQYMAHLLL